MIACVAVMAAACTSKQPSQGGATGMIRGDVVATVDGKAITSEALREAARPELQRIEMKVYQINKRMLDDLIEQRLIASAAKAEGMSADAYLKKKIDDRMSKPTEKEMKAIYEARKGRDTRPFKEVKDQIAQYLEQNQRKRLRQDLVAKLRAGADVKVYLDAPRVTIGVEGAPSIGSDDAKITLVEFSDYQCPFSKRARDTVAEMLDTYKDKIFYVFRDFPLSFHRDAQKGAEAAYCAGDQGKYFEYNKKLFDNQMDMKVEDLRHYAKELGLNTTKFNRCLDGGTYAARVQKSIEDGTSAGVSGTPAFFINGILVSGAQPLAAFREIIETELQR